MPERIQGKVKFFNDARGFGFLTTPQGDVFLHASALPAETEVGEGDQVSFEIEEGPRGKKAVAVRVEG